MAKTVEIPEYGLLYFDHLHGEYLLIANFLMPDERQICSDIQTKRAERELTWDDIYAFQLILLKYQDFETLKSKIISLRIKYQGLVDIAEYNGYLALRAVDLTVPITDADADKLRADYKYLLDEFYLRYAYASTREELRTKLLRWGAWLTLASLALAMVFAVLTFNSAIGGALLGGFSNLVIVIFAGIIGAFVSMQQRLQAISNQGDPIYNLSLLTHGWLSIFLSPISGAIFAVILYLFFASGLLEGKIFPKIITTNLPTVEFTVQETRGNSANSNQNSANSNANAADSTTVNTNVAANTETANQNTTTQSNSNAPGKSATGTVPIGLRSFLLRVSPETGKDFALLLIWCFIAGFAERFVPDTLMRLVSQKKANEAAVA